MRPPVRRWIAGLVVTPYVAFFGAVAPEHAHEPDGDHPHSTVHRHLQTHVAGSPDHDHAQLADDDDHIVWLNNDAAFYEIAYQLSCDALPATDAFVVVPPVVDRVVRPDYDTAPPHGPPRTALSLRAPPSLAV